MGADTVLLHANENTELAGIVANSPFASLKQLALVLALVFLPRLEKKKP